MRVLIVKTSSMGDVIHTLPALTDAGQHYPAIQFDWVVEENFQEIPAWHPLVRRVIPVAFRRWRKTFFSRKTWAEWKTYQKILSKEPYDVIIDAQGLVKSAFLTFFAKGERSGLDWQSAREKLASLSYQQKYTVNFYQHAVVRMRQLFAAVLKYPQPTSLPDYGVDRTRFVLDKASDPYLIFLHG